MIAHLIRSEKIKVPFLSNVTNQTFTVGHYGNLITAQNTLSGYVFHSRDMLLYLIIFHTKGEKWRLVNIG